MLYDLPYHASLHSPTFPGTQRGDYILFPEIVQRRKSGLPRNERETLRSLFDWSRLSAMTCCYTVVWSRFWRCVVTVVRCASRGRSVSRSQSYNRQIRTRTISRHDGRARWLSQSERQRRACVVRDVTGSSPGPVCPKRFMSHHHCITSSVSLILAVSSSPPLAYDRKQAK